MCRYSVHVIKPGTPPSPADLRHVMRKPALCISEKKDAVTAKLLSAFVFATWIVTIPLLSKSKISSLYSQAIFCAYTARLVSNPFGNLIVGFLMTCSAFCHYIIFSLTLRKHAHMIYSNFLRSKSIIFRENFLIFFLFLLKT